MNHEDDATVLEANDATALVSRDDLQVAFATLLDVHETINDLRARCLSGADIANANQMIRTLDDRLNGYKLTCERLTESLREAERRALFYKRRSADVEAKLTSLQRTISQHLTEYLVEDDVFGASPFGAHKTRCASPAPQTAEA